MFYVKGIDITNDRQMFEFLKNHFQYYTMNSWNRLKSIAHNVKIYNLGLSGDSWTALALLQDDDYFEVNLMIEDWEAEHPGYKVGFNGRSGGYLVLYPANRADTILSADVDECEDYEEYKRYCREFYGSVKANRYDLIQMVKIVQDFDRLCDDLRDYVDDLSNRSFVVEALKESVDQFNDQYSEDLEYLEFDDLHVEGDKVNVSEICQVRSLYEAFCRIADKTDLGYKLKHDGDYISYIVC